MLLGFLKGADVDMNAPQGVHLVGSINLPTVETVMRSVSSALSGHVRRIPDGEVGDRFHWIAFQANRLAGSAGLERVGDRPFMVAPGLDVRPVRISDGVDASEVSIGALGYAHAASEAWSIFQRLHAEGAIPEGVRFQVSLPTPAAVVGAFVVAEDRAALEPVYRDALFGELDQILALIPHERLAVQWDTAVEFGFIEDAGYQKNGGNNAPWFSDVWAGVVERAVDQIAHVPEPAHVGFHLCYGDIGEQHFVEPQDSGNLVRFAERVIAASPRSVNWIHLPVPFERDDDAYFVPLGGLDLPAVTELYLGLVHREDGVEGARRRIDTALRHVRSFGVGTECGFGRSPAEATDDLLKVHAEVAARW